ncbi:PAAR domain-containing protein [Ancylobacter amanitiformis]|uniref:Zn-binding protein involved in type VI secretion n=1 Tax=Ancylobacter amanitiformis TaxID=217069 RepID=A0ABU0LQB1_9HYPH|nr:PAAR domain-containing protein [Ancylobacter amanitiformis]MDQ0510881.1 putative Zn-binding protein involved in type VI secretion [Ancylobacter amanitiformis]
MPGVACVSVDVAGGVQLGMQAAKFKVRGQPVVVVGDAVAPHPPDPPHSAAPYMVEGTAKFRVSGIAVCRAGHVANCGHPTTGRPFFRIP